MEPSGGQRGSCAPSLARSSSTCTTGKTSPSRYSQDLHNREDFALALFPGLAQPERLRPRAIPRTCTTGKTSTAPMPSFLDSLEELEKGSAEQRKCDNQGLSGGNDRRLKLEQPKPKASAVRREPEIVKLEPRRPRSRSPKKRGPRDDSGLGREKREASQRGSSDHVKEERAGSSGSACRVKRERSRALQEGPRRERSRSPLERSRRKRSRSPLERPRPSSC